MVKLTQDMVAARAKTSDMEGLAKLNFWGSDLTDISIVRQFKRAEILSFSLNMIVTLSHFKFCTNLRELYIRRNRIQDLRELCYLQELPKLRILLLSENPCCETAGDLYRPTVVRALPNLEILDNDEITPTEREDAMEVGLVLEHPGHRKNKETGIGVTRFYDGHASPCNQSTMMNRLTQGNSSDDFANSNTSKRTDEITPHPRPSTATSFMNYHCSGRSWDQENQHTQFFSESHKIKNGPCDLTLMSNGFQRSDHFGSVFGSLRSDNSQKSSKNVVSAVICLINELDIESLDSVISVIKKRQQELLN
ncbi:unnamed protein product [Allacma fusca]|uniref:U2A'/phosphoprotein 32 family A C-terminal domain-containing protein n=1 Tax=Allacma fusca TaxID=39272 RepID=A0A8J2PG01_9HEXA|nr:unnamed protein product [Allacma fusca]